MGKSAPEPHTIFPDYVDVDGFESLCFIPPKEGNETGSRRVATDRDVYFVLKDGPRNPLDEYITHGNVLHPCKPKSTFT